MKEFFKKVTLRACVYYTILVGIFSLVLIFMYSAEDTDLALDPTRVLLFLPFCVSLATAGAVLKGDKMSAPARWFLHAILVIGGAFLFLLLPANMPGAQNLVGFFLIAIAYTFFALFYAIFKKRIRTSIEEDKVLREKSKQYGKQKKQ